ncbi:hypothetical protein LTR84_006491 [Exophiala bonariae]|uniref:Zn(2)-C6 fungal-type domain-containing protein n=1 Tax=Exophiala bonariae TaxID=1690606 RepID=A0AAV9N2K9_9EURO|nr:hypothetical protein LTR84_006491 [Exophiala bonariae]
MSVGSRSRTGCLTCRIRKKKCDEQRPACQTCHSIEVTCFGYNAPLPAWFTTKASWEEVKDSAEAKALRNLAATRYKIRRKFGLKKGNVLPATALLRDAQGSDFGGNHLAQATAKLTETTTSTVTISCSRTVVTPNIWQLYPESIWWDSAINNLVPGSSCSHRQNTRLLTMFLEVIHPITHGFYQLPSNKDRSWLLARLVGDEALYNIALSVSACFDHSLTEPPKTDSIGICPQVRRLQNRAIAQLHPRIHKFVTEENQSLEELICLGLSLLDVVLNLINLEIFSMLQGYWEIHYQAARLLLNDIELRSLSKVDSSTKLNDSPIGSLLSSSSIDDQQKRSMEFCIMNFVWIDVIAISTFGVTAYSPCAFDYLSLLKNGVIETQRAMGCQGWIMAMIVAIARLEPAKSTQCTQGTTIHPMVDVTQRGLQLAEELKSGLEKLEKERDQFNGPAVSNLDEDIRLCFSGHINPGTPLGRIEDVYGRSTYIANPPDGKAPKGIIVIIPDAFGQEFVNNQILADHYASMGQYRVYLPDFMDGAKKQTPVVNLGTYSQICSYYFIKVVIDFVPHLIRNRFGVCWPRVTSFLRALREDKSTTLPVGIAGFCWGGLYPFILNHDRPDAKTKDGRPLADAFFAAHASSVTVPGDMEAITMNLSYAIGDDDAVMNMQQVRQLQEILARKENVDSEVVIYPGAQHGFAVRASRTEPDAKETKQAEEAEKQAVAWFQRRFEAIKTAAAS